MAHRALLLLLTLLLSFHLGFAQNSTQAPTPTITGATILTVPLQSLYTAHIQPTLTFEQTTTENGAVQTATVTWDLVGGIQASAVAVGAGYILNEFSDNDYAICWFQTSGNWSLLPRVLFYITIVFALVARSHQWLIAGALASSLTFSSIAAVQISLQIWTRRIMAELDLFPILGILSTSCIIVVPLMNWSSTIRDLGLSKEKLKARQANHGAIQASSGQKQSGNDSQSQYKRFENAAPTRTVLVIWGFVVAVGFLSGFSGLRDMRQGKEYISLYTYAGANSVHCVPDNGILNLTAGQYPLWSSFWFDAEFMSINNCENPCTSLPEGESTLFRSPAELRILTAQNIDSVIEGTDRTKKAENALRFTDFYFKYMLFGLPFILLQGLMHVVLFRRESPERARYQIYAGLVKLHDRNFTPSLLRKRIAFSFAMAFYLFALLILVISPFAIVLNVCATEIYLYSVPQNDDNTSVGQWGVMAGTIFILIAALICRFERGVKHYVYRARDDTKQAAHHKIKHLVDVEVGKYKLEEYTVPGRRRRESSYVPDMDYFSSLFQSINMVFLKAFGSVRSWIKEFFGILLHEWRLFVQFCEDPLIEPTSWQESKATAPLVPVAEKATNAANPQSLLVEDSERPRSSSAPSAANNMTIRTGRSIAFAHGNPSGKEASTTSPPPLGERRISHPRKPVSTTPSYQSTFKYPTEISPTELLPRQQPRTYSIPPSEAADGRQRDSLTVTGSLNDSITDRSRRSNIYSPEPDDDHYPTAHDTVMHSSPTSLVHNQAQRTASSNSINGPIPISSEQDLVPPLPSPSNFHLDKNDKHPTPAIAAAASDESPSTNLPKLSRRSSHLFSEDELANLYRNGTAQTRSVMGSRNSASVLSGSGGADERRTRASRISYLQIQTGRDFADAQAWGDQVVLRRDQYGGWVVVDAGEDTGERSVGDYEDDDAGSSEKSEKLDHEEVGKW